MHRQREGMPAVQTSLSEGGGFEVGAGIDQRLDRKGDAIAKKWTGAGCSGEGVDGSLGFVT